MAEHITRGIIQLGNFCKNHQVNSILISSLVCQNSVHLNRKIKSQLKLCLPNGYLFFNNSNTTEIHLTDHGLYLKEGGKCVFANTFTNVLNGFL